MDLIVLRDPLYVMEIRRTDKGEAWGEVYSCNRIDLRWSALPSLGQIPGRLTPKDENF